MNLSNLKIWGWKGRGGRCHHPGPRNIPLSMQRNAVAWIYSCQLAITIFSEMFHPFQRSFIMLYLQILHAGSRSFFRVFTDGFNLTCAFWETTNTTGYISSNFVYQQRPTSKTPLSQVGRPSLATFAHTVYTVYCLASASHLHLQASLFPATQYKPNSHYRTILAL